jgi:hypothetical protein
MPGPLLFLPPRLAASSGRFRFTARLTDAAAARFGIPALEVGRSGEIIEGLVPGAAFGGLRDSNPGTNGPALRRLSRL